MGPDQEVADVHSGSFTAQPLVESNDSVSVTIHVERIIKSGQAFTHAAHILKPPLTVDGPINGPLFLAWVEQHLVPTLSPGDVVIMDNLSSHKVAGVREAIESVGAALRYLPHYSPDLNPIELAFAKLKKLLRDGAERTVDKLWELCGRILDEFTPTECQNYFKHCGYRYV